MGCVYLITNTVNGKVYVGKTTYSLLRRWQLHATASRQGSLQVIHRAIRKYGAEAFSRQVLHFAQTEKKLNELEMLEIRQRNTTNSSIGYNQTLGGDGQIPTKETKLKMRLAKLGKPSPNLGKKLPKEWRDNMSKVRIGSSHSLETRLKMRKSQSLRRRRERGGL